MEEEEKREEESYEFNFTEAMMEELHMEGKLEVRINEQIVNFTFNKEDEEIIEDKSNDEIIIAMLDDELDEYIDKLTNSIKEL
tara:strand:+ start:864 stop:1112 length:249 start_codon:yes stop_codon:yes gene_type:complete